MKNLLISPVGDNSFHSLWLRDKANFDTWLIYYGNDEKIAAQCQSQVPFFTRMKGTKFNILKTLIDADPEFFANYDYVFVPDDDLYLGTKEINHLFELAQEYQLELCQPSLIGYYDVPITLHSPCCLLRYTNHVEIICPCFSRSAFKKCAITFDYNVSTWGIDLWWNKLLGEPRDKLAIIDDVIAVHTRPCTMGDVYTNNNIQDPWKDINELIEEHQLSHERIEYSRIWQDAYWKYANAAERYYPPMDFMPNLCETLRKKWEI